MDAASGRLDTVRGKATSLLGFVALLTPILSWWLLTGRERVASAPIALAVIVYVLILISAAGLLLCLRALFRSQSVASYRAQTPALFVNLDTAELVTHDWAGELIEQVRVWGDVQRWSDVVTDYFRAGQRFLSISLVTAILAGVVSYLYPQSTNAVALVALPTGQLAVKVQTVQRTRSPNRALGSGNVVRRRGGRGGRNCLHGRPAALPAKGNDHASTPRVQKPDFSHGRSSTENSRISRADKWHVSSGYSEPLGH
ncbi:MAG: hypothetical protein U0791_06955 [Gemmataceae bacterium]